MAVFDINIVRGDDAPPWLDLQHRDLVHLPDTIWHLVGLEDGTASGSPSCALRLDLPDGRSVLAETTLAAWIAATCALRGAFPEAFDGTPLAVQP